jgi:hypothetical protein
MIHVALPQIVLWILIAKDSRDTVAIYMNNVISDIIALQNYNGLIYKHVNLLNKMDSLVILTMIAVLDHIVGI